MLRSERNTCVSGNTVTSLPSASERSFQLGVIELAVVCRWKVYHVHNARRSNPAWPDLVLLRGRRVIAAELKSAKGRVRPEQRQWLDALEVAGVEVHVFRPSDWPLIKATLR
jgi:VRR-NUC domain